MRQLRSVAGSVILRDACDQVLRQLAAGAASRAASPAGPAYLAGLLAGAAHAVERARSRQSVQVAWTGPSSGATSSRLTAAAVINLIAEARAEILLVSYATQTEPQPRAIRDHVNGLHAAGQLRRLP